MSWQTVLSVVGAVVALTGAFFAGTTSGVSVVEARSDTDHSIAVASVRQLLERQVEAWNAGDLEAFMSGYLNAKSLRFVSDATVRSGWLETLDRYRDTYPDRSAMGQLSFEDLDIQVLSSDWAYVFGGYRLRRETDEPHGVFTLLVNKQPDGWRIVHDQTSSAAE